MSFRLPRLAAPAISVLLVSLVLSVQSFASNPATVTVTRTNPNVTWTGTAVATGAAPTNAESSCVEGVNCDTLILKVVGNRSDYAGKLIQVRIGWTIDANDYDLYVHRDSNAGAEVGHSYDGAPQTSETTVIDPITLSPDANNVTTYTVHVVYFTVTPGDQYVGTTQLVDKPPTRPVNYVIGGRLQFSPSVRLKAPVARRDGEPSNRTDKQGNAYIGGIRGVPAGVDLWYFDLRPGSSTYDPYMRNPIYRGMPDAFDMAKASAVGADGGGDIDLAVGFPDPATGATNDPPTLAFNSLVLANISTGKSTDRGVTYQRNPVGSASGGIPVDDRQWIEFLGKDVVYLLYRTFQPAVTQIQRSNDGGVTFGPARTAGGIGQVGSIDVHQKTGTVYIAGSTGQVCVGVPDPLTGEPTTYSCKTAASDPSGVAHLFFIAKVADDGTPNGTVYAVYSNDRDILLVFSQDKGKTWSLPVRVSNPDVAAMNIMPHMETGPTPGSVGIVWYGTVNEGINSDRADWRLYYAYSSNATAEVPTFTQVEAGDHIIHGSNISEGGTLGNANRNLLDYFQVSFDPTGAAVIAYTDDHNDFDGHSYVTRQIAGPGINGVAVPAPAEGASLPPRPAPADGTVVQDFVNDLGINSGTIAQNDPLDIVSIKYSCEDPNAGTSSSSPMLVARMKVSDLSSVPSMSNWRMNFAANAPNAVVSPTGDYTFAVSDRGDQFFVRASTDPSVSATFTYGRAVRASTGALTYTIVGPADSGMFDAATQTITVKVALSKLNALIPAGHNPIAPGAILAGLRGQTFTSNANAKVDITRGGSQFALACSGATHGGGNGGGGKDDGPVARITGSGAIDGKAETFSLQVENNFGDLTAPPSGQVKYKDNGAKFEMVSDAIDTFTQNGANEVVLTGRGHIGDQSVTFTVRVQDNGEPGSNDFFSITISGRDAHQGTLTQGNVQFHR